MASHNHRLRSTINTDSVGMLGGDMFARIRQYADYLNEKRESYKLTGYDFCKVKRRFVCSCWNYKCKRCILILFLRKDDNLLRTMPTDQVRSSDCM